jgi:DNA-binding beta-propeller fold protein YncE
MQSWSAGAALAAIITGLTAANAGAAPFLIVGNDEKLAFNAEGKQVRSAPGKDTVSIIDIADPANPKIVTDIPLMNSVMGPPTNLAITPDNKLALIANSVQWNQDGETWKSDPDTKVHVIDLEAEPPAVVGEVEVGGQPSGMTISKAGDMALVANRAGKSVTLLSIDGKTVTRVADVEMGDAPAAVALSPDGRSGLAAMFPASKAAILEIGDGKIATTGAIPTGLHPYNIAITPDGSLGFTADNGSATGSSDGHVDTVTVIDLEADPPRAIDKIVVGDAPEGFTVSPKGDLAVAVLLNGSWGVPEKAWFANPTSKMVLLAIDGKTVTKTGEVEVGAFAEGVAFSPDGSHLYVANYKDSDLWVLKVDGTTVTDTGTRLALPGQPGSMRSSVP